MVEGGNSLSEMDARSLAATLPPAIRYLHRDFVSLYAEQAISSKGRIFGCGTRLPMQQLAHRRLAKRVRLTCELGCGDAFYFLSLMAVPQ